MSCKFVLMTVLLVLAALPAAAQTAARADYDLNFIGPPLADPVLQHSKETYVLFGCAYCHGLNLVSRGEATDLMHSRLVGKDTDGNLIGPLLRAGIPQTAKLSPMPQFSDLSDQQIGDLVRWIHYARQQGRYKELVEDKNAPSGDASAGKAYFEQTCRGCHAGTELPKLAASGDPKVLLLRPKVLGQPRSWQMTKLQDTANATARAKHLSLLENYTPQDVANLLAFLRNPK